MMRAIALGLTLASVVSLNGCGGGNDPSISSNKSVTSLSDQQVSSGIDTSHFDHKVRFQDDFFTAVNGQWIKNTPIPPERANYGTFVQLQERSEKAIHQIMEQSQAHPNTAEAQKISAFYQAYMDTEKTDELGITPVQPMLQQVSAIDSLGDLSETFAMLEIDGLNMPLDLQVDGDAKDAQTYALYLQQSGLTLPDRDYYLSDNARYQQIRQAYRDYLVEIFRLSAVKSPESAADDVISVETALANAQWSRVDSRDIDKTYNKMSAEQVSKLLGAMSWRAYAKTADISGVKAVIVSQPSYFETLGGLVKSIPLSKWQNYIRAQLLTHYANYLTIDYRQAHFSFFGRVLGGKEEQPPRWKEAVDDGNQLFGQLLGKIYVKEHFSAESKAAAESLVQDLLTAYQQSIQSLDWMSPETRQKALTKLSLFTAKIGYPDHWRDYSRLEFDADSLVSDIRRAHQFDSHYWMTRIGKPVNRDEWFMNPQTINAYYNPNMNEIVFPAAILQLPFFDAKVDMATNFGGIGAVIGHEISHGFDDQGSKFDGYGNLNNWWTAADREAFKVKTERLVQQYQNYYPLPDQHINGQLTLGENIGDLSGLSVAYKAYHLALGEHTDTIIDGFSGDQRFFLSWAQVWCYKYRENNLRERLVTDPHSPAPFRVNGVVRNLPAFYQAFDVHKRDKMYLPPEQRVHIW